jgi:hypothetical protein
MNETFYVGKIKLWWDEPAKHYEIVGSTTEHGRVWQKEVGVNPWLAIYYADRTGDIQAEGDTPQAAFEALLVKLRRIYADLTDLLS